jgi:hypothetical protein
MALGALLGAELDYAGELLGLILEHALGTVRSDALGPTLGPTRRDGALGAVLGEPLGPALSTHFPDRSSVGS